MNKNILLILALLAIAYTGCKDVAYKPTAPSPSYSYFPETYGSSWKYRDSIYGEKTDTAGIYGVRIDTVTYSINGLTTDFNSAICYNADVFSKLNGHGTAYFYANKHRISLNQYTAPFGQTIFQMLIDTASVGYTWIGNPTQNTLLNGNPAITINTVVEKGISKMVNGITYNDVIHTTANLQINVNGKGYHNIAFYDFYLSKGIGLIEKDSYVYGLLNATQTILAYDVRGN